MFSSRGMLMLHLCPQVKLLLAKPRHAFSSLSLANGNFRSRWLTWEGHVRSFASLLLKAYEDFWLLIYAPLVWSGQVHVH